jgi:hypothetical protein
MEEPQQVDLRAVPRWVVSDYEGAEREFSDWIASALYWLRWDNKVLTEGEKARALAEAKDAAIRRSIALQGFMERATMWQLYKARHEQWIMLLGEEYDNFNEYLAALIEDNQDIMRMHGGSFTDYKYLLTTLMPVLESHGVDIEKLMSMRGKWSKLRDVIPSIRQAVEANPPDLADKLNGYIDMVADDDLSVRELRGKLKKERPDPIVQKMIGTMYIVPEGFVLAVDVPSQIQVTAVQGALSALVDEWKIGSAFDLGRKILDGKESDSKRADEAAG